MRSYRLPCGVVLLSVSILGGLAASAQTASEKGAAPASAASKTELELRKLRAEVDKITEESRGLRETNEALGASTRRMTAWAGALGGATVTLLVALAGFVLNRTQREKLVQDAEQAREKHLLDIFRGLGDDKPRIRTGAIAVLVQRIRQIRSSESRPEDTRELPTIIGALAVATWHEDNVQIQKYLADGLAESLGALVPPGSEPQTAESPLRVASFQRAKLTNAMWQRIDARGVDFYGATLTRVSLRAAFLSGAVLKKADLGDSTLEDARLDGANLEEANLSRARLARADLRNAKLRGAVLEGADLTDADLTGADLRNAKLAGARLDGAKLEGAQTGGADFGGAASPQ
jgi:pentapeptide repeat protein